jgi:hypothetical protein
MCSSPDTASSEAAKNPAPLAPTPTPCPHPDGQTLELERKYHDLEAVQGAAFRVQLWDGSLVNGKLDAQGKAQVPVSVAPVRVQYGPDSREYSWYQPDNPDYRPDMSSAELEAFVSARLKRS